MQEIPAAVQTQFHDFCESCPLCDITIDENKFYAYDKVYMRESIITCKYYNFCARMAKAVNDGLVDMRNTQKPVSNVDTKENV